MSFHADDERTGINVPKLYRRPRKRLFSSDLNVHAGDGSRGVVVDAYITRKGFTEENVAKVLGKNEQRTAGDGNAARIAANIPLLQLQKRIA